MILKLQNQCTLALNGLVEKALAVGGDPKHIELTSVEAFDLLRELKSNKDVLRHYTYSDEGFGFRISGADVKEIDVDSAEILDCNEGAASLLGVASSMLRGKLWTQVITCGADSDGVLTQAIQSGRQQGRRLFPPRPAWR